MSERTQLGGDGHPRRWWILVAICASLLIVVVDNTVLSVALPAIAEAFGAGTATLQAVVDAYVVVFAGLLVTAGVAADRYGRRRVLLVGLVVFAMASAAAGLAGAVWILVGARAVMGIGAALVMPATLAILVQVFPEHERPRAFAAWAAVAAVAMAAGPVLGGLLVELWSWGGVFWINVPLALGAVAVVAALAPESRDPDAGRLDSVSAVLVTAGISSVVLTVLVLGENGSLIIAWSAGILAVLGLGWFTRRQLRSSAPMVEFALYRDPRFAGGSVAAAVLTLGTGSALFVLTQYLQLVRGQSALEAGVSLVPLALSIVIASIIGGRSATRVGPRICIVSGFVVVTAGFLLLAMLGPSSSYPHVAAGLALLGLGAGFSGPAVTSVVLGAVPRHRAGMGSGLHDTHQQLGIAIGVAVMGAILTSVYRSRMVDLVGVEDGALALTLLRGDANLARAGTEAFVAAQSTTMIVAAGCAASGALIAALVLRSRRTSRAKTAPV
ncbi:MFS transporter [Pseudonocardia sp. HH130629-09]|uniref:MFS transporter n=1 Tax=Pseudonocardia sp. HH130629-09 TaxID=1641402 RepID=UPI0006CAFCC4|nr:MFS transporter [Pseudonocardia sp. HH130629-09]ALE82808.1 major facilitator transporter [Pseudonocardia sp. HH130629-09]